MTTTYKVKTTFKSFEGCNNLITGKTIGTDSLNFFESIDGIVDTDLLEEGEGYAIIEVTIDEAMSKPVPKFKKDKFGIENYTFI